MYPFTFKHMHIWMGLSSCIISYLAINSANLLLFELDYDTIVGYKFTICVVSIIRRNDHAGLFMEREGST